MRVSASTTRVFVAFSTVNLVFPLCAAGVLHQVISHAADRRAPAPALL